MEKRLHTAPAQFFCNCPNQLLLLPGCECDLCMGIVAEHDGQVTDDASLPQEHYDQSYFEALERLYSSFDYAAHAPSRERSYRRPA